MFITKNRGWLLLAEIPFRGEQFDQYLHLKNTRDNRRAAERLKREIENCHSCGHVRERVREKISQLSAPRALRPRIKYGTHARRVRDLPWLPEKPKLTAATRYDYESQLRFHLLPHPLAAMRLGAINDGHVNRFIRDLQAKQTRSKKPLSNRRINMVISRLRDIFATAYRRKLIAENPMLHVENLRETKSEVDPFDLDETLRIIVAAQGWERALLTVLLFTGMRPGEALALRLKAIDGITTSSASERRSTVGTASAHQRHRGPNVMST